MTLLPISMDSPPSLFTSILVLSDKVFDPIDAPVQHGKEMPASTPWDAVECG